MKTKTKKRNLFVYWNKTLLCCLILSISYVFMGGVNAQDGLFYADPYTICERFGFRPNDIKPEDELECPTVNDLTPAEIIYHCALENRINPVLLISKLQAEQGLIKDYDADPSEVGKQDFNFTNPDHVDLLEWKLLRATGYGMADEGKDNPKYYGFYSQAINFTWQFDNYRKKGYSFDVAFGKYTTDSDAYDAFTTVEENANGEPSGIYPTYVKEMNRIIKERVSSFSEYDDKPLGNNGHGDGYFNDFMGCDPNDPNDPSDHLSDPCNLGYLDYPNDNPDDNELVVRVADIQKLLDLLNSPLRHDLFSKTPSQPSTNHLFTLNNRISHLYWPFEEPYNFNVGNSHYANSRPDSDTGEIYIYNNDITTNNTWFNHSDDKHKYPSGDAKAFDYYYNDNYGACGKKILAPLSGTVIYRGNSNPEYGNQVIIQSNDGNFAFRVAHMESIASNVIVNEDINAGADLGTVGNINGICRAHFVLYKHIMNNTVISDNYKGCDECNDCANQKKCFVYKEENCANCDDCKKNDGCKIDECVACICEKDECSDWTTCSECNDDDLCKYDESARNKLINGESLGCGKIQYLNSAAFWFDAIQPTTLRFPTNGTPIGSSANFIWDKMPTGTAEYRIHISTLGEDDWDEKRGFAPIGEPNNTSTLLPINEPLGNVNEYNLDNSGLLQTGVIYHWSVKTFYPGLGEIWSEPESFVTLGTNHVAPSNNAQDVSYNEDIAWATNVGTVAKTEGTTESEMQYEVNYTIQISTSKDNWTPENGFTSYNTISPDIPVNLPVGSNKSFTWDPAIYTYYYPPKSNTTYYWSVKTDVDIYPDAYETWTVPWSFTTTPDCIQPYNLQINPFSNDGARFNWIGNGDSYQVAIANYGFNNWWYSDEIPIGIIDLFGLNLETYYDIAIISYCGDTHSVSYYWFIIHANASKDQRDSEPGFTYELKLKETNLENIPIDFNQRFSKLTTGESQLANIGLDNIPFDFVQSPVESDFFEFVNISPNPVRPNQNLNIVFNLPEESEKSVQIEIYNINSEKIQSKKLTDLNIGINKVDYQLGNLSPGVYICLITTENKQYSKKFVVSE